MLKQIVDLNVPIASKKVGAPPLTLNVEVTRGTEFSEAGPTATRMVNETYVLFSALPPHVQNSVRAVIDVLVAGQ